MIVTGIECQTCGHVRETTEENPTLVACRACGSKDIEYVDPSDATDGAADGS